MKTTIITLLTALGVAAWLLPAAAQTAGRQDNNNAAAVQDQSTPPDTTPGQSVQDQSAQDQATEEQGAQDQSAQDQGTMQEQTAQEQGAMGAEQAARSAQAPPARFQRRPFRFTPRGRTSRGSAPQTVASAFAPPAGPVSTNQGDLNMNFANAPLNQVLAYLSDAAGFIVVQEVPVSGYVTIQGKNITKSQAVNLLNTALNRNNYAVIRDGRQLTIVRQGDATASRIPVRTGNNPAQIPDNAELATWIIPIRFVEAQQLVSELSQFRSPNATIVADPAGNSIVITDTQANIHHLAEIIQAVDNGAQAETVIRVFQMKYANPDDVANELSQMFPSGNTTGGTAPIRFGGRRGRGGAGNFFARMMAGNGNNGNSETTQQRLQKASQVTAVADGRTQSVIVSAPQNLMDQIADMMTELDVPSQRDPQVATIQLKNADPQQVANVLQSMFGNPNSSRGGSSSTEQSALQQRAQNGVTTMGNTTTTSGIGSQNSFGGRGGGRGG